MIGICFAIVSWWHLICLWKMWFRSFILNLFHFLSFYSRPKCLASVLVPVYLYMRVEKLIKITKKAISKRKKFMYDNYLAVVYSQIWANSHVKPSNNLINILILHFELIFRNRIFKWRIKSNFYELISLFFVGMLAYFWVN